MESLTVQEFQQLRRRLSPTFLILSEAGDVLAYGLGPGRRCLGRTQRPILRELLHGPMTLAELSRTLGKVRRTVHASLQRLEEEGLVTSLRAPGRTHRGSWVLKRFYTLNPETVLLAHPVPNLTPEDLRTEADASQHRGILRQRLWEAREKLGSPYLETRGHGRRLLEQVRDEAQAALDADTRRRTPRRRHPTTKPLHGTP